MKSVLLFALVGIMIHIQSCSHHATETPQSLMKKYERLVREMKADSISQLFTMDAEVGHGDKKPIKGRDSIYAFLSSFKNVHVLSNLDSILSVDEKDDSAVVQGNYIQTVVISEKDTVHVAGKFTATIILNEKHWLIARMRTRSL